MSTRLTNIIIAVLIVVTIIASAIIYPQLPENVASHWNEQGEVDGYMTRFWGVALMPIALVGMVLLLLLIPLIDPLRANIAKFRDYYNVLILMLVVFMIYIHTLTLLWNLGYSQFSMNVALLPAMGFLFIIIGFLIRKAKRNFFIGIRTPWTLSNDKVWDETHRLGGIVFILSGILAVIGVFFSDYALWFVFVPLLGSVIFLVVYSYVLFERETRKSK